MRPTRVRPGPEMRTSHAACPPEESGRPSAAHARSRKCALRPTVAWHRPKPAASEAVGEAVDRDVSGVAQASAADKRWVMLDGLLRRADGEPTAPAALERRRLDAVGLGGASGGGLAGAKGSVEDVRRSLSRSRFMARRRCARRVGARPLACALGLRLPRLRLPRPLALVLRAVGRL